MPPACSTTRVRVCRVQLYSDAVVAHAPRSLAALHSSVACACALVPRTQPAAGVLLPAMWLGACCCATRGGAACQQRCAQVAWWGALAFLRACSFSTRVRLMHRRRLCARCCGRVQRTLCACCGPPAFLAAEGSSLSPRRQRGGTDCSRMRVVGRGCVQRAHTPGCGVSRVCCWDCRRAVGVLAAPFLLTHPSMPVTHKGLAALLARWLRRGTVRWSRRVAHAHFLTGLFPLGRPLTADGAVLLCAGGSSPPCCVWFVCAPTLEFLPRVTPRPLDGPTCHAPSLWARCVPPPHNIEMVLVAACCTLAARTYVRARTRRCRGTLPSRCRASSRAGRAGCMPSGNACVVCAALAVRVLVSAARAAASSTHNVFSRRCLPVCTAVVGCNTHTRVILVRYTRCCSAVRAWRSSGRWSGRPCVMLRLSARQQRCLLGCCPQAAPRVPSTALATAVTAPLCVWGGGGGDQSKIPPRAVAAPANLSQTGLRPHKGTRRQACTQRPPATRRVRARRAGCAPCLAAGRTQRPPHAAHAPAPPAAAAARLQRPLPPAPRCPPPAKARAAHASERASARAVLRRLQTLGRCAGAATEQHASPRTSSTRGASSRASRDTCAGGPWHWAAGRALAPACDAIDPLTPWHTVSSA
jgi:hypothetical protein